MPKSDLCVLAVVGAKVSLVCAGGGWCQSLTCVLAVVGTKV